jgi:hypothetical protein
VAHPQLFRVNVLRQPRYTFHVEVAHPAKGEAEDIISPDAKTFDQRWFVDGRQVQMVVGKNGNGNWMTTWEVHVTIDKAGDKPVYSAVP